MHFLKNLGFGIFSFISLLGMAQGADCAQIIYLKSGGSVIGEIVQDKSTADYYIVDVYTGEIPVMKSNVLRIVESQEYVNSRAQAEAMTQQKRWIKAALLYEKAMGSTDDAAIKKACRSEIEAICIEAMDELKHGNPQSLDFQQCYEIARKTENPMIVDQMQRMILEAQLEEYRRWMKSGETAKRLFKYDEAIQSYDQAITLASSMSHIGSATSSGVGWEYLQEARNQKAKIYIERAHPLFKSNKPNEKEMAERYLLEALEVQPDHDRANYMLGWVLRTESDGTRSAGYLKKVRDSSELTEDERRAIRNVIDRYEERKERKAKRREMAQLENQQPVKSSPKFSADSVIENLWQQWENNSGSIAQQIKVLAPPIGAIIGIFLFLYYIPYRITKRYAPSINPFPPDSDSSGKTVPGRRFNYVRVARFTGILGLLVFLATRLIPDGSKKNKVFCSHCKKELESPVIFKDLDFNRCPYCRKTIKAPFKMQDYIRGLGEAIARDRAAAEGKRGRDATSMATSDSTLKLIRSVLTYALRLRSSDIHIEAEEPGDLLFRMRVDGVLHDGVRLPASLHSMVITSIKNMASLDIAERRIPQDGHFNIFVDKTELNIRVATTPTSTGEKAVLRLLMPKESILGLHDLGFSAEGLMKFEKAVMNPHGIILSTGPTGSGKSTTLYSCLSLLCDGQKNIVTIEDPIEYKIPGVNQMQVNTKAGLTFGTALRSILRQDPDVIMVGEIRDHETAEIACSAALTGHLVFSTLHTIDSSTALSRLIDLGIEPKQVASAVVAIIAQRLVRTICPHCIRPYRPRKEELEKMGFDPDTTDPELRFQHGAGCPQCQNSGYLGRTGLFEILMVQFGKGNIQKALEAASSTSAIRLAARRDGMRTLREEGILKVIEGVTTVAEVLRVTQEEIRADLNPFSEQQYQ